MSKKHRHHPRLTDRELEIVYHVTRELTNAQIAQKLGISKQAVKDHLTKIYRKLGLQSRYQLIDRKKFLEIFLRHISQMVVFFFTSIYKNH